MIHSKDQNYPPLGAPELQEYLKEIKGSKEEEEDSFKVEWEHLRRLKDGQRLNFTPTIQPYCVATHCYYVGLLFVHFAREEDIVVLPEETVWVFKHDLLETVTGDVLYPAKNFNPVVKDYWDRIEKELVEDKYHYLKWFTDNQARFRTTKEVWNLFKAVDLLELYEFCKEEIKLGNNSSIIHNIINLCHTTIFNFGFESIRKWIFV